MFVQMLGIIDLLTAFVVMLHGFLPSHLLSTFALIMLTKGAFFLLFGDMMSIGDIITGLYLFLLVFNISFFLGTALVAFYLLQKALFSMA